MHLTSKLFFVKLSPSNRFDISHEFHSSYIETQQVEKPDIVLGIHPGLHADGVYEFWEPTLDLLLDHNITTVFTVLDRKEYSQSLKQLDRLFCKYLFKGKNAFGSKHVKQTPHDPDLMWSSNQYIIVFKVSQEHFGRNVSSFCNHQTFPANFGLNISQSFYPRNGTNV